METEKAFILINTVKCIGDEYKAVTQSGTEIYVKKDELIPYVRFPEGPDESFGFVKVNGKAFTADTVKIIIQIYEGLIRRFERETDKENSKRLQDAEIGKSQRKQSNADRIRNMTDEELAKFLSEFSACNVCEYYDPETHRCDTDSNFLCVKAYAEAIIGDWLKQPVEE